MIRYLRPILALVLVSAYLAIGATFVYVGKASGDSFLANLASMVGMIVAFLFGERAAMKRTTGGNPE